MIKVTVDCDNDKIIIDEAEFKVRYPNQFINILDELIHRMSSGYEIASVSLNKISEGKESMIQEW